MNGRRKVLLVGLCLCGSCLLAAASCALSPRPSPPENRLRAWEAAAAAAGLYARGSHEKALDAYAEALRLSRSLDDRETEIAGLINLGRVSIALGRYGDAATYLAEAVHLALALNDKDALSEAYASLAKTSLLAGDPAAALNHIREALRIDEATGRRSGARLNLLAGIYAGLDRRTEAHQVLTQALALNRAAGDAAETANSYRAIAEIRAAAEQWEEALDAYRKAYESDREAGLSRKIAHDLEQMAGIQQKVGRISEAVFLYERSYVVSLTGGNRKDAVRTLEKLILACRQAGNEERATFFAGLRQRILQEMPDTARE